MPASAESLRLLTPFRRSPTTAHPLPMPIRPTLRHRLLAASLAALACLPAAASAAGHVAVQTDQRPALDALLECQAGVEAFATLVGPVDEPLQAVALGWAPQPRSNPFMAEYRLNTPARAFGHGSDWLAIAGGTVMLVLDQAQISPQALASALSLEVVVDENGKFMAGREVVSRDRPDLEAGQVLIESAVLGVSTVDSHPGKLLLGCTYSLDAPEDEADRDGNPVLPAQSAD